MERTGLTVTVPVWPAGLLRGAEVRWVAAIRVTLRPPVVQRVGFALVGPLQRLFQHVDAAPGEYTEADISPYYWHNGAFPAPRHTGACSMMVSPPIGSRSEVWRKPGRALSGGSAGTSTSPRFLHPGMVRACQVGRRVDVQHPGPGPAPAAGSLDGVQSVSPRTEGQEVGVL